MSKITSLIIFSIGAAVGAAVTYELVRKKQAEEQVEVTFSDISERRRRKTAEEIIQEKREKAGEYADICMEHGYIDYSGRSKEEVRRTVEKNVGDVPYVISPEELGNLPDYETITLTYYADGALTDDTDELVEDVEETVGLDSLNHFGEYEDDTVCVRNDRLRADFEILRDERTYESVTGFSVYGSSREDKC